MKTNGHTIHKHGLTLAKTRPLLKQLAAVVKQRDKLVRKRERLMNDNKSTNFKDVELRAKIARLDGYISRENFIIVNLQSQLGSSTDPRPAFNRQSVSRAKHVEPDKGRIVFSTIGDYKVENHRKVLPKKPSEDSIIQVVQ